MIKREIYTDRLIAYKDKELIKVVTGIRRCGKSTLLEMFREYLVQNEVSQDQIISINFEDPAYKRLLDSDELYSYISGKMTEGRMNYIFLDEIQQVRDFERAVDGLFIKKNTDIYITGSNAWMLSGELATLLSGRYIEINMLPLSFKEYVSAFENRSSLSALYRDYVRFSSFPYALNFENNSQYVREYLSGIYNTVIIKDIITRNGIGDIMMLESVASFLFSNIGSLCSSRKISDTLTSNGRKISIPTVEKYLSALVESYIFYRAGRYDVKGKQHLKTLDKYYTADVGMRRMLLGDSEIDIGHTLENVIFLELIRRGYRVSVGVTGDAEVDFIAETGSGVEYYQVAATVRDRGVLARELAPLESIRNHFPKFVLTLDEDPDVYHNGIKCMNALDFLLQERSAV